MLTSILALATGTLIADPQRRTAANGNEYATALLRADVEGEPTIISLIAFGKQAAALAACGGGDSISVSGKAKLTVWTDRNGTERHGLGVTIEQLAALKLHRKSAAGAQRGAASARPRRRSPYSSSQRSSRDSVPDLPQDTVGDLYAAPAS